MINRRKIKAEWVSWLHNVRRRELELVFSKCPEKIFRTGLELGAGEGFQSSLLTKYVSKLISTDYNSGILKNENNELIEYRKCDAEKVDKMFEKEQFDLVFSSHLLEHLPGPTKALKGINKILKDKGITIHVVPTPFLKLCHLLLYIPDRIVAILEALKEREGISEIPKAIKNHTNNSEQDYDPNPKIERPPKSLIWNLLVPEPHGASSTNIKEFYAFSKTRWENQFKKADLDLVKIIKGPVASGYGFGWNTIRDILERVGMSSSYIYIAIKKGKKSSYIQYF